MIDELHMRVGLEPITSPSAWHLKQEAQLELELIGHRNTKLGWIPSHHIIYFQNWVKRRKMIDKLEVGPHLSKKNKLEVGPHLAHVPHMDSKNYITYIYII